MGSGTKNKDKVDMGQTPFDDDYWIAYRWCLKNNIRISPRAKANNAWFIEIENHGKIHTSPETYGKTEIWNKIFEYCKYYFNKYNN